MAAAARLEAAAHCTIKDEGGCMKDAPSTRPTPQVTIEAIMLCVRERGLGALQEPANLERLARCDAAARKQIKDRLAKLTDNAKSF